MVEFDARYLDAASLQRIVRTADVVLLPYDSPDQVTSGVLTEAVVACRPVISTPFPHAVELLSSGAGLLVPQRGTRGDRRGRPPGAHRTWACRSRWRATARMLAPALLWSAVADGVRGRSPHDLAVGCAPAVAPL